ncbi:MAG: DUF2779 domain-containing protein [Bacteroidota bacterium]|nr:DUF2779 domain-containing protein [Bacteroidota bacterium]
MKIKLTKTAFVQGLTCHKALYLSKNNPDLGEPITPAQQHLFDVGSEVDKLSRELFPEGIDVNENTFNTKEMIMNTEILLSIGTKILYQASFSTLSGFCRTDILTNENNKINLYEVKSSTSISLVHYADVAFQYCIMNEAGYRPESVFIVLLNNEYVRGQELDVFKLFKIIDVTKEVLNLQEDIERGIMELGEMLSEVNPPLKDIGKHCDSPYPCEFKKHCWKLIPDNSVFEIARMRKDKKFELYAKGIVRMEDIPKEEKLNANQKMQVEYALKKKMFFNKIEISNFLMSLNYPIYFLDFETSNPAIPRYEGTKPFQQITFQFSLHIQKKLQGPVKHKEFLANPEDDFREELIKSLLENTKGEGTILTYNQSFEIGRLKELAVQFPKYKKELENRISRVRDLMIIFRDRHFYHFEQKGSYSIKSVIPILAPELSYQNLEIKDGGTASVVFEQLKKLSPTERKLKRLFLLEYCKRDTYAMVWILKELESLLKSV